MSDKPALLPQQAFLIEAYREKSSMAANVRQRCYGLTRNFVVSAVAFNVITMTSGVFKSHSSAKVVIVYAIVILTILAILKIRVSYKALYAVNGILASIEEAMGFHETGLYIEGRALYPQEIASARALRSGQYEWRFRFGYKLVILLAGAITAALLLLGEAQTSAVASDVDSASMKRTCIPIGNLQICMMKP